MYLIQVSVDLVAAARHAGAFHSHTALRDPDFVLKTVLSDALQGPVLRPWALRGRHGHRAVLVGYSALEPEEIRGRTLGALPSALEALPPQDILGYALPSLAVGARLAFSIRLCPTVRVTPGQGRRHGERDVFLVAADAAGAEAGLRREEVYADYLGRRLTGTRMEAVRMEAFRLHRISRKDGDWVGTKTIPDALMAGVLTVEDPVALGASMAAGVGRQRAFGFGMLQLAEPERRN